MDRVWKKCLKYRHALGCSSVFKSLDTNTPKSLSTAVDFLSCPFNRYSLCNPYCPHIIFEGGSMDCIDCTRLWNFICQCAWLSIHSHWNSRAIPPVSSYPSSGHHNHLYSSMLYTFASLAKKLLGHSNFFTRSFIYTKNNIGPSTDLFGTPDMILFRVIFSSWSQLLASFDSKTPWSTSATLQLSPLLFTLS